jgi:GAF domain-containing protein
MSEEQKTESGDTGAAGAERVIQEALDIAREALGMDAGYVAEFTEDEQVYRRLAGDAGSFEMREDEGFPIEGTYCRRMVAGEIPNVVSDSAADEAVRDLAITKLGEIGSYVGVPITFSDGRIYGTVCTISHEAREDLSERDVLVLKAIAKLMGSELEREAMSDENRKLAARVAELEEQVEELQGAVQAAEATGSDDFVDVRGWRPD